MIREHAIPKDFRYLHATPYKVCPSNMCFQRRISGKIQLCSVVVGM